VSKTKENGISASEKVNETLNLDLNDLLVERLLGVL
jgi:hypothetical protein